MYILEKYNPFIGLEFITANKLENSPVPEQRQKRCLHYHGTKMLHFSRFQTINVLEKYWWNLMIPYIYLKFPNIQKQKKE